MDEKLKTTIEKIVQLSKQKPEFEVELRKALGKEPSANGVYLGDERIYQIYEYCIEKILKKQAEDFYIDFPLKTIIPTLTSDFVRMESFRRRDQFGDFCLALYQQIECISNHLCERRDLSEIADKMWGCSAYVKSGKDVVTSISERQNLDKNNPFMIASLVFPGMNKKQNLPNSVVKSKQTIQTLYASDKIRAVIYFLGYKTMMKNSDYDNYVEITSLISDAYQCRNMNHRGNTLTQWEEETIARILPLKSFYYFKFMGALAQFVSFIKEGMKGIDIMYSYSQSIEKQSVIVPKRPKIVGKLELNESGRK